MLDKRRNECHCELPYGKHPPRRRPKSVIRFDAVMQEQNIMRAAHNLGMSQPAVSNAVARLKVMFNDELFMRQGCGIQPTQRARQQFGPIRQALQLIRNELPSSVLHRKPQRVCLSSRSAVLAIYALLLRSWHRLMN